MRQLDKSKRYNLEYLTADEKEEVFNYLKEFSEWKDFNVDDFKQGLNKGICFNKQYNFWMMTNNGLNTNAKELFYTLENIQVDCSELSEDQIKKMSDVFENAGYKAWDDPNALKKIQDDDDYLRLDWVNYFYINCKSDTKTTITYEKFMELFSNKEENFKKLVEVLNEELTEEAYKGTEYEVKYIAEKPKQYQIGIDTFNPQPHYNNENGSLYKIANDLGLNHWEFDIFKRLVRCRKKNQFKEDLQKIKDTIDIYLNEFTDEK